MPAQARYDILATCVLELHRVGILDSASPTPLPHSQLPAPNQVGPVFPTGVHVTSTSLQRFFGITVPLERGVSGIVHA